MNTQPLEEALTLCDNMLTQLTSENASHEALTILSNIKNKIIYGLEEIENTPKIIDEDEEDQQIKFHIGDRVECINETDYVKNGATGTVQEEDYIPYVKWDKLEYLNQYTEDLTWAIAQEDLKKI